MSFLRVIIVVLAVANVSPVLRAENFITTADAQKLMFPTATSFESRIVRYTRADIRAIEQRSAVKVQRSGNRFWVARSGTNLLGIIFSDQVIGKHELIDYAVAISMEGKVQSVEILAYRESYGGEIRGAKWRSQFKGKTADDPFRLNRDIYNLSGATMSCRSVSEGVKRLLATFDCVVRPQLPGDDVVPGPTHVRAGD